MIASTVLPKARALQSGQEQEPQHPRAARKGLRILATSSARGAGASVVVSHVLYPFLGGTIFPIHDHPLDRGTAAHGVPAVHVDLTRLPAISRALAEQTGHVIVDVNSGSQATFVDFVSSDLGGLGSFDAIVVPVQRGHHFESRAISTVNWLLASQADPAVVRFVYNKIPTKFDRVGANLEPKELAEAYPLFTRFLKQSPLRLGSGQICHLPERTLLDLGRSDAAIDEHDPVHSEEDAAGRTQKAAVRARIYEMMVNHVKPTIRAAYSALVDGLPREADFGLATQF